MRDLKSNIAIAQALAPATYDADNSPVAIDLQGLDSVGSGGVVKAITSAHASADVTKIGYVGGRRYLKLLADFGGTHSAGTPISSVVIKGNPTTSPVS